MKKITSLVLIFVFAISCLFGFTSCDPTANVLDTDELLTNTVKIELVNYKNDNLKIILNLDGNNKPTFDFNKVTLIATLDDSKIEDVVNCIGNYDFLYFSRTYNEPIGKTLVLYQKNGDMLVLYGCIYTNSKGSTVFPGACIIFDKDGNYVEYIGDFGYAGMDTIVHRYFPDTFDSVL